MEKISYAKPLICDILPLTLEEVFTTAHDVIEAGGVGITFGRSVIQAKDPTAMVTTLGKIVHERMSVQEALEFYNDLSNK